jgi:hypothetical protein
MWGFGFSFMPALLTSCHFGNYLCRTSWHGDVSPLVTIWSLFPWMLPVAIAAAGGLGLVALGALLLFTADPAKAADEPLHAVAFCICIVSLFAILAAGGFGYFLFETISPGFYYARSETVRLAWLTVQLFFVSLYLSGVVLTLAPSARDSSPSTASSWRQS